MFAVICSILSFKLTSGKRFKITMIIVSLLPFVGVYLLSKLYFLIDDSTKGGAPMYETLYYTVSMPFVLFYVLSNLVIYLIRKKSTGSSLV